MGLLGKLTGADKAKKQAKDARKMAAQREGAALGELTPEAMQNLMQMFFSKYMALLAPQMMHAQQGIAASAGRTGKTGAGLTRALSAGVPGQFANVALGKSIEPALSVAGQRAGIRMEKPIITNPARSGLTDLADLALQYYTAGTVSTGSTKQGPRTF